MIKLKDILNESTNVELHKIITEKDTPPFMTEAQWNKKWSGKDRLDEGIGRMIAGGIRKLIAKMIVAALAPPADKIDKLFRFSGGKAIRKHGHGKANPYLKGLYKPLIKYAETGRLKPAEAVVLRDAILQQGAPTVLGYGLAGPVILVMKALTGSLHLWIIPVLGEIISQLIQRFGVEWFLYGWDGDTIDIKDVKRKVKKAAAKNLSNAPKLPTHIGGISLQNYPTKK